MNVNNKRLLKASIDETWFSSTVWTWLEPESHFEQIRLVSNQYQSYEQ